MRETRQRQLRERSCCWWSLEGRMHVWSVDSPSVKSGQTRPRLPDRKQHAEVVYLLSATNQNQKWLFYYCQHLERMFRRSRGQRRWVTRWVLMTRLHKNFSFFSPTKKNYCELTAFVLSYVNVTRALAESFEDAWCRFWECLFWVFFFLSHPKHLQYICLFCK